MYVRVKFSPKNIFLLVTLLVTAAICFVSYIISKEQFRAYVSQTYIENVSIYTNSLAKEYFDLSGTNSLSKSGQPAQYINAIMRNNDIRSAKITDANSSVIGSNNPAELNTALMDDPDWEAAINGEPNINKVDLTNGVATLSLPLISENNVVRGVLVINANLPGSFLMVDKFTNVVLYIVLGSALVFILAAYVTMYELESKMEEKERSIFDQSKAQTEEKQLYEAITTSIAESLIVISKNKQIMMLNPEAERLIGQKGSSVEYRSYEKIINFYDENGKRITKDPIAEGLTKGNIFQISSKDGYHVKGQNGKLTPVAVNVAPIAEGKSFVKGVAVTIIDISAEKELQKVKDEFVYVVAHELGNPIFALDGYLSLLDSHAKKISKEGRDILRSAHGINQQLSSLVNDLLEVARNETGRLTFDIEKIDLPAILAEVIQNNSFKARDKKVQISYKAKKLPKVNGNERKIKEVLTNLLDNAIKYTSSKGKVTIDSYLHENQVVVSVTDTGIGLSDENKKHLFEKFFRVKNKATEGISGTGLGLFIAKQIIEKCGGKIWATSVEGKGSTFYISLKVSK